MPYARVHLTTSDGKYKTIYADQNGTAILRLPPYNNEFFNVTITGHNLIPSYFNFTTVSDDFKPEIREVDWQPKNPSISDNICFNITTLDNHSGIESVFILLSKNNFKDYNYYRMLNHIQKEEINFECIFNKLDPGKYSFLIVARDYANNSEILYNENFRFSIPPPITDYILVFALVMLISLAGISFFVIFYGLRKHKDNIRNTV